FVEGLVVELRARRSTHHAFALGIGFECWLQRCSTQGIPTEAILAIEADRGGKIVDPALLLVRLVAALAFPEETLRDDDLRKTRAILALGDIGKLLARCIEDRVTGLRRHLD